MWTSAHAYRDYGQACQHCEIKSFPTYLWVNTQKKTEKENLAKIIQEEQRLKLPNVALSNRELSEFHQDVEVGRWKVIRSELDARQLPHFEVITGKDAEPGVKRLKSYRFKRALRRNQTSLPVPKLLKKKVSKVPGP